MQCPHLLQRALVDLQWNVIEKDLHVCNTQEIPHPDQYNMQKGQYTVWQFIAVPKEFPDAFVLW